MICDCGSQPHRIWCTTRREELEAAEAHGYVNVALFGAFVLSVMFGAAYRSEIAGWWHAWREIVGYVLVYGLTVVGLLWMAYGRRR